LGERMMEVVNALGIRTTFCVIMPGYPADLYERIRASGHEIALHYDAMGAPGDERTLSQWGEPYARAQHAWLLAATGLKSLVSNKNHYTRWEGRLEFFEWCERLGIQAEQSRGPSKLGCAGFPFGTAHPWFPMREDGTRIDVLEVGFQSQDLVIFAPPAAHRPLVDQCVAHHGIVHLIFHPAHIAKDGVEDALRALIDYGRQRGMEWWSCERINAWERARRRVRLSWVDGGVLRLESPVEMAGATLLFLEPRGAGLEVAAGEGDAGRVERYGFEFMVVVRELAAGEVVHVAIETRS
jgi:peptidoglycan/xylan/chitin deacetylase (PgdA/CDA1 family)